MANYLHPDAVRSAIEDWVRAEPHCSIALQVRVVPTEGGLYVFAQERRAEIEAGLNLALALLKGSVVPGANDDAYFKP